MLALRRILASLLVSAALICGVMAFVAGKGVTHSINNSREIEGRFYAAATRVTAFQRAHGRLPTPSEFNAEATERRAPYEVLLAEPGFTGCDTHAEAFAQLQPPDYVLMVWRGEWMECYAPTKRISTLTTDPADYTLSGSSGRDRLIFTTAMIACLALAIGLWRRQS